ncbi:hypothetical protein FY048_12750 [Acinetobacter sp. 1124_18A]|uniref:hypothetical protein n=1 Tax=Acinetobacter sp. 1124_18A TaxID=2605958 RepID=UPI00405935AA
MGLEGELNPYIYADGNPIVDGLNSRIGRIAAIRPMSDPLISANVTRIETEIRRFDPNFRYQKLVPSWQPTYNVNDVLFLQNRLFQFQARRQTEIDNLIRSANQIYSEQGITALIRAWDKHAGRQGVRFNADNSFSGLLDPKWNK